MEVISHLVEASDLGRLHVVRFTPSTASGDDLGIHFGGYRSRIDTVDTFGAAYTIASVRNMVVDLIERPGNGLSTLPESSHLRKDYMRFGFVAVCDAIKEAQAKDVTFKSARRLHVSGMSLGGHVAVQYLDGNKRASSATLFDPSGLRHRASKTEAFGRYLLASALEIPVGMVRLKPGVEAIFQQEHELYESYHEFLKANPHLIKPTKQKGADKAEFREACRPADGAGVDSAISLMQEALDDGREFELRASRSGARLISDHRSVEVINQKLSQFDVANPGVNQPGSPVRYGFSQDGPWWHSLAIAPVAVRKLIETPIDQLQTRLK